MSANIAMLLRRWRQRLTVLAVGLLVLATGTCAAEASASRVRLLIKTDAGGDPDDEQSLVRFLLYANEWDVEGIIANRPTVRAGENRTRDPDGHPLTWEWFTYPEAGSYRCEVPLHPGPADVAKLTIPSDAAGKTLHAMAMVTDAGTPPLTRHRRTVIETRTH